MGCAIHLTDKAINLGFSLIFDQMTWQRYVPRLLALTAVVAVRGNFV